MALAKDRDTTSNPDTSIHSNSQAEPALNSLEGLIELLAALQDSPASPASTAQTRKSDPPLTSPPQKTPSPVEPATTELPQSAVSSPHAPERSDSVASARPPESSERPDSVSSARPPESPERPRATEALLPSRPSHRSAELSTLEMLQSLTQRPPQVEPKPPSPLAKSPAKSSLSNQDIDGLKREVEQLADQLDTIRKQVYEPTDIINPLIPLITELLRLKSTASREELAAALTPIIDDVIAQRSQQNREAMSSAISSLIPRAIQQQIQNSPEEIAKAIAPEIGSAIEEQIRLERNAISKALAPEMGKAIKAQIDLERESMIDALYPVIGSTISKYMGEAIRTINQQVENALSPKGVQRKIRAKMLGVSEAELILQEAMPFTVQAVFLIQAASGLVIAEVQSSSEHRLESDLMAGMLTAIRSFANDCFARSGSVSELDQIDYGDSRIIIEFVGYCYLAAVVKGDPPKAFINSLREQLGLITLRYGNAIEEFDGDLSKVPPAIHNRLEALSEEFQPNRPTKRPMALLAIVFAILGIALIPWGIWQYHQHVNRQISAKISLALLSSPELSVYRVVPEVRRDSVTLRGRVPTEYLRSKAEAVTQLEAPNRELINRIIAVNVPPDPELVAAEVQRLATLLNQQGNMAIAAEYENEQVNVQGILFNDTDPQLMVQAFEQIPGVRKVVTMFNLEQDVVNSRFYFELGSIEPNPNDLNQKLIPLRNLLQKHPAIHLRIIGHSDTIGTPADRRKIATQRAEAIQKLLQAQGIAANRLQTSGTLELPPGISPTAPLHLSRCVRFEVILKPNTQ